MICGVKATPHSVYVLYHFLGKLVLGWLFNMVKAREPSQPVLALQKTVPNWNYMGESWDDGIYVMIDDDLSMNNGDFP